MNKRQGNLTSFLLCVLEKLSEMMYDVKVNSNACDYRSIDTIAFHTLQQKILFLLPRKDIAPPLSGICMPPQSHGLPQHTCI